MPCCAGLSAGTNRLIIIWGKLMSANAKMRGITPPPAILMGMTVDCPPYILRPFTCFAYCTGMRLSERSTATIAVNSRMVSTKKPSSIHSALRSPPNRSPNFSTMVMPAVEMMPTKIMSEMPLPTPYSVILSPMNMTSMAPAVYTTTRNMPASHVAAVSDIIPLSPPPNITTLMAPSVLAAMFTIMPIAWAMARTMVT